MPAQKGAAGFRLEAQPLVLGIGGGVLFGLGWAVAGACPGVDSFEKTQMLFGNPIPAEPLRGETCGLAEGTTPSRIG